MAWQRRRVHMSRYLEEEYRGYVEALGGDEEGRRRAWKAMEAGFARTGRGTDPISYLPICFDREEREFLERSATTVHSIMTKILRAYRERADIRRLYRLDSRVEELLMIDTGCRELLPACRLDAIFDEESRSFHFLEFNTDASGGMAEAAESYRAISSTEPFRRFAAEHGAFSYAQSLYGRLVSSFRRIYQESDAPEAHPHVAIAVLFDSPNAMVSELAEYIGYFEREGMGCSVFDVRELWEENGVLVGHRSLAGKSNVRVDAIWRFVIVVDLLEHWAEVQPFLSALKDRKAVMIGSFLTQAVHDKQLFALLRRPEILGLLTENERAFVSRHIPYTSFIDAEDFDIESLRRNKDEWILKPTDWYGSQKVIAGRSMEMDSWLQMIEKCLHDSRPWLAQRNVPAYISKALPLHGLEKEYTSCEVEVGNILGMYIYSGAFAGIYMRQGSGSVIGTAHGEIAAPVIWTER